MKKRLVIIGGGATGAVIALHAHQALHKYLEIIIIDPNEEVGLGKAYKTADDENILNVGVSNMGLYGNNPNHFADWLKFNNFSEQDFPFWPFVPRKVFGNYIKSCLNEISFTHLKALVVNVKSNIFNYSLKLDNGHSIKAHYVIVATGYCEDYNIFSHLIDKKNSEKILYPVEAEKIDFKSKESILIVGSGLTAIDVWKRIRKFNTKITMISRHGILPIAHTAHTKIKIPNLGGMSPIQIFDVLRLLENTKAYTWQQIADEVRIQSKCIWSCWSAKEKKQFIRHLKPYWEVIRHRVPNPIAQLISNDLKNNFLTVLSGKIKNIEVINNKVQVIAKLKKSKTPYESHFDYIVLATGSMINQNLFKNVSGIKFSSNGFGYINVSAPNIWFAGPSSKATFWEITAIPDIRNQASQIIERVQHDVLKSQKLLLLTLFEQHPKSVGESYFVHLKQSLKFSHLLLTKVFQILIHSIFPFYYTDKTSNDIRDFSANISKRRFKDF